MSIEGVAANSDHLTHAADCLDSVAEAVTEVAHAALEVEMWQHRKVSVDELQEAQRDGRALTKSLKVVGLLQAQGQVFGITRVCRDVLSQKVPSKR